MNRLSTHHAALASQRGCAFLVGVLVAAALLLGTPYPVQAADDVTPAQAGNFCRTVTAIPQSECEALVALFIATDGPNWDNRSGWGVQASPCTWFGVGCAGGHVASLELPSNRLNGPLPERLGDLTRLERLILNDNLLSGPLPHAICALAQSVTAADFAYNRLDGTNAQVRQCLTVMDPDWHISQTVAPRDVTVTDITTATLTLAWQPIPYIADGGHYEVGIGPAPNGPFSAHGTTADKTATGYVIDNLTPGETYFIRVRTFTPAHAAQENDLLSDATGTIATTSFDGDPLLVLIYFPADNDLSPYVDFLAQRVRRGTAINPNVRVLFLADKRGDNNTGLFEIANGTITPTGAVLSEWGRAELDTTDPAVLAWFLSYGRSRYPTARTVVSLMGHGLGLTPEFGWVLPDDAAGLSAATPATSISRIPPLPRGIEATPGDFNDRGGYMSTVGFGQALAAATDDGANPFDIVFFDQCFQGNLDVLYEVRDYADVLIASPNYAWLAAPYHQYMAVFSPAATAEAMAEGLIRIYEAALTNAHPNAIFWLRSADLDPIVAATNQLAQALRGALALGRDVAIAKAAENAAYVDTTQCGPGKFKLGPPDELMGAASFARNLQDAFAPGDAQGVHSAAGELLDALDAVTVSYRAGIPYIAPDEYWDYQDSLTLLAPLRRDAPGGVAWRASVYVKDAPVTAVWSPDPQVRVHISQTVAFAAEGAWSDFIADWYTGPLTPTLGQWCQYVPPALVGGENVEPLTLALEAGESALTLTWTPTAAEEATAYWILARGDGDVNWVVLATVPIAETSLTTDLPAPGQSVDYQVVAQDDLAVTLAESNAVSYTAPVAVPNVYLPQVAK